MSKRLLNVNMAASLLQVMVHTMVTFLLYGYLLKTLGASQLGLWSLVLAVTSISRMANLGLTGGVVKFVAQYAAHGDHGLVRQAIETTLVTISVTLGGALVILYPAVRAILQWVTGPDHATIVATILPYAALAIWLAAVSSVCFAGLDGLQLIYKRNCVTILVTICHAAGCVFSVTRWGLTGLAVCAVAQNAMTIAISWWLLHRCGAISALPYRWSRQMFREMFLYSLSFQVVAILRILLEPLTKGMLSVFGGVAMVGYYEMANKMITPLRSWIVAATASLVPYTANLQEIAAEQIRLVYSNYSRLVFFLAVPLYTLIGILVPLISLVWIGSPDQHFIVFASLLLPGALVNTLASVAYFMHLGVGTPQWNMSAYLAIAISNLIAGFVLGSLMGEAGVVVAWSLSLAFGSAIIMITFDRTQDVRSIMCTRDNLRLGIAAVATYSLAGIVYFLTWETRVWPWAVPIMLCLYGALMLPAIWQHSTRAAVNGKIYRWMGYQM